MACDRSSLLKPKIKSLTDSLMLQKNKNVTIMWLDMRINAKKSACIRFGPRYDTDCFQIVTANGDIIE